jgi:hypothetical protein
MNIEDLTLKQIREIQKITCGVEQESGSFSHPFKIGGKYLIRTVTMIDTGKVIEVTPQYIVLEDAAWIADTGRFSDALKSAKFNEVEPFPDGKVIIGAGSVIDAVEISELPRSQK